MASHRKSPTSTTRLVASALLAFAFVTPCRPALAARDAGQMIAQDKANKAVIARRQAALDVANAVARPDKSVAQREPSTSTKK